MPGKRARDAIIRTENNNKRSQNRLHERLVATGQERRRFLEI
jgi:hypothetical protein